jgi:hypothetical protein
VAKQHEAMRTISRKYVAQLLHYPSGRRLASHVEVQNRAVTLRDAAWIRDEGVTLDNLSEAEQNEDDFDACFTAAALLRCVLDGSPLCPSPIESPTIDGGIL